MSEICGNTNIFLTSESLFLGGILSSESFVGGTEFLHLLLRQLLKCASLLTC